MAIAVVGCGSIGQRHITNLRALGVQDVLGADPNADRRASARALGAVDYDGLSTMLAQKPEAVLVCTPPNLHLQAASQAVEAGTQLFIEKPISHTLDGIWELFAAARRRSITVMVGYNLRFHPGLLRLKELLDGGAVGRALVIQAEFGQYLPDWRPDADYRNGYNARADTGGGIVLDASHEIDYVRWLGGEVTDVQCAMGHLSGLEVETEDVAALTLQLAGGAIAEIHLDCVQRGYTRRCKIIGEDGTLLWDYETGVRLLSAGRPGEWQDFPVQADPNDMYLAEMEHFLACLRGDAEPAVTGATGLRVLEIALAAKESAKLGKVIDL